MTQQKNIIMYTTSWCPDCRAAKRYLTGKGLTWQEVDIEKDEDAAERVVQWSGGYRTVPTFDIEGAIVVDFDRAKLDTTLGLK
jgi:mycoredoxin